MKLSYPEGRSLPQRNTSKIWETSCDQLLLFVRPLALLPDWHTLISANKHLLIPLWRLLVKMPRVWIDRTHSDLVSFVRRRERLARTGQRRRRRRQHLLESRPQYFLLSHNCQRFKSVQSIDRYFSPQQSFVYLADDSHDQRQRYRFACQCHKNIEAAINAIKVAASTIAVN